MVFFVQAKHKKKKKNDNKFLLCFVFVLLFVLFCFCLFVLFSFVFYLFDFLVHLRCLLSSDRFISVLILSYHLPFKIVNKGDRRLFKWELLFE